MEFLRGLRDYKVYKVEDVEEIVSEMELSLRSKGKVKYYNSPVAFDIETSSFKQDGMKFNIMYIWGFCINGKVIVGRTWEEFKELIGKLVKKLELSKEKRLIVYVHNLAYEFQYLRKHFEWIEQPFALSNREVSKAITTDGIEFKCSYLLSAYSLKKTGENLNKYKVRKMVGDLDYDKVRHSETPLTPQEMKYLMNDVKVVSAYIQEEIEAHNNNITQIEMTNTGKVRNYTRNICLYGDGVHDQTNKKYRNHLKMMRSLTLDMEQYRLCKRAFQGGFTHCNPKYMGRICRSVSSYDLTSAYPSVMVKKKFPMSKPKYEPIFTEGSFRELLETGRLVVATVSFRGLVSKCDFDNYISGSNKEKFLTGMEGEYFLQNGRVVWADFANISITDVDFRIIEQTYTWESMSVEECYSFKAGYLPSGIIEAILTLYKNKTELKGVADMIIEYLHSKGMLNSIYGCMVMDILRKQAYYDGETDDPMKVWIEKEPSEGKLSFYNMDQKRFSYYPWGLWITAYVREIIWNAILELKDDYRYTDTDSIKFVNLEKHRAYFEEFNRKNREEMDKAMKWFGYDLERTRPKTKKGVEKQLGEFDYEGTYSLFKTLGAKRYLTRTGFEDELTVAGTGKHSTMEYLSKEYGNIKAFEVFDDNLHIPAEATGKQIPTFLDREQEGEVEDYLGNKYHFKELSSIYLEAVPYDLGISEEYYSFCQGLFSFRS